MKMYNKDITNEKTGLILHGVNCQGAMGSGVAGAIRSKWPSVYAGYINHLSQYKALGDTGQALGDVNVVKVGEDLYVANGFSQEFFGGDGKRYANLDAVEQCIENSIHYANNLGVDLKMPLIGCGLGGLSWENEVRPIVEKLEKIHQIEIQVFYI